MYKFGVQIYQTAILGSTDVRDHFLVYRPTNGQAESKDTPCTIYIWGLRKRPIMNIGDKVLEESS